MISTKQSYSALCLSIKLGETAGFDFQNICWIARMSQIFKIFYLRVTSFVGLGQIVSIFHGNFSTILGLFQGLSPVVQSALLVCSSPWPEPLALLVLRSSFRAPWGNGNPFFLAVSQWTSTRIWPRSQHCRTHSEGVETTWSRQETVALVLCWKPCMYFTFKCSQLLWTDPGAGPSIRDRSQTCSLNTSPSSWALMPGNEP